MLNDNCKNAEPYMDDVSPEPKTASMLTDWNDAKTAAFQKEVMSFGHNLASTGLFSDEALISLLERHPMEKMDVCTMGHATDPLYPNKFRTPSHECS